jgi:hypothetical protein
MQTDLAELRITGNQLEKLTGLEISEAFMGRAFRPGLFRSTRRWLPFLLTEALTLGVIVIFCLPASLVIARGVGLLTAGNTLPFLLIALGIAIAIFLTWNGLMWQKGQQLKTLAHLLDEVDKHNEIIDAMQVMDELDAVQRSTRSAINREEVLKALTATRESLINALMTEKILRKHKNLIYHRPELFRNIETTLGTLQALQVTNQANEYGQLLHEALQIGLSIRRELEPFQRE